MASSDEPSELNLTPYLDVLMNLIVFVLLSGAGLVTFGVLPAKTAAARSPGAEGAVVPRVHLERGGVSLAVSGAAAEPLTLDELTARLSLMDGRAVVIDAAKEVTLEQVAAAMDAARKAHFDEVTLAD